MSCWAFETLGAIDGRRKFGDLASLTKCDAGRSAQMDLPRQWRLVVDRFYIDSPRESSR
jgi:hypothetical protein